jgi:hypothetical protein
MALAAVYLYLQWKLYHAISSVAACTLKQHQVTVVNLFFACMFIFVPAYTRVRLPKVVASLFAVGLAVAFVANLALPCGLWFSGEPTLIPSTFRGEPYTNVIAPSMGAPQLAFAFFVMSYMSVAFVCAAKMYARGGGERQRAVTFAIALAFVIGYGLIDIIRDNVGGSWPYLVEYGIVGWAVIMSVQLARDFRRSTQSLGIAIEVVDVQSRQLTTMLDALRALDRDMRRSLGTLETGVVALAQGTTLADEQMCRIVRAVARLEELACSMPELTSPRTSPAHARTDRRVHR